MNFMHQMFKDEHMVHTKCLYITEVAYFSKALYPCILNCI